MPSAHPLTLMSDVAERDSRPVPSWTVPASLASVIFAFLPFLLIQGRALWLRPHYQFFPLVLIGVVVLVRRELRELAGIEPGARRSADRFIALAWMLLLIAVVSFSLWLGTVAAMVALLAIAYAFGGRPLLVKTLPAWLFLSLAIPPPLNLDVKLIGRLQRFATQASGSVLDQVGVFHVVEGNSVNIAGRTLLIEEACSGIHSLFAVITCVFFGALWMRRSPGRTILLLGAGVFWVLLANVLRIVTVVWLVAEWGVAADTGWRHEALGALSFVVALALAASTDRLAAAVSAVVRRKTDRMPSAQEPAALCDRSWSIRRWPSSAATRLGSRRLALAFGLLAITQLVVHRGVWGEALWSESRLNRNLQNLSADSLPAQSGPFRRVDFRVTERETGNQMGKRSQTWCYSAGEQQAAVSIDAPFWGWHDLADCYTGLGWSTLSRSILDENLTPTERGSLVEMTFATPSGHHAYLLFTLQNHRGEPLDASGAGSRVLATLRERAQRIGDAVTTNDVSRLAPPFMLACFQTQLCIESDDPLTRDQKARARALFRDAHATVKNACFRRAGGRNE